MKYFEKENLWAEIGGDAIGMRDSEYDDKSVFVIEKFGDEINFLEGGRDQYYSKMMSKREAIEALKEAIKWIESNE